MIKLLAVFAASVVLAYISDRNTQAILASGSRYTVFKDWAYIALVAILVLFAGLRTGYNDTWNYMNGFRNITGFSEFLEDPNNFNPFRNPLFYIFEYGLRSITDNAHILVFLTSLVTQVCFVLFFKRYSENFAFSIFIYFTLGTFVFSLAAMKQVLAMAIFTLAFPCLEKKKWVRYYLIVFIAMLIHTYALAFAVLPFFRVRPWRLFTFTFVVLMVVIMMNFREAITAFMDQAEEVGKILYDAEIFDNATTNLFRLAVYAVIPLISFIFRKWIFIDSTENDHVLAHMSIISLAFMVMGTQSGANMFGRMATYFEIGTVCCLPSMLKKTFDDRSYQLISIIAACCFMGYFVYANGINTVFSEHYTSISLFEFIMRLIK